MGVTMTGGLSLLGLKLKPIIAEAEGEGVVIFPEKKCLIHLNETGVYVYRKLQEGYTPKDIAKMIAKEYDVEEEKALKDIKEFIVSLNERGLFNEENL